MNGHVVPPQPNSRAQNSKGELNDGRNMSFDKAFSAYNS